MVKVILIIICIFVIPSTIAGIVSSYRAGQKPHRDLYLIFKKFAQRKNK